MSFENYAQQMAQKWRLATALAVINSKPNDLTIDQYIDQIKNNLSEEIDDFNISVCSEDFNDDSNDFNVQTEDFENNDCNSDPKFVSNDHNDQIFMSSHNLINHNDSPHLMIKDNVRNDERYDEKEDLRIVKFRYLPELRGNKEHMKHPLTQSQSQNQDSSVDMDWTQCSQPHNNTSCPNTETSKADMASDLSQDITGNSQSILDLSLRADSTNNIPNAIQNYNVPFKNTSQEIVNNNTKHTTEEMYVHRAKIAKKIHTVEDLKANVSKYAAGIYKDSNKNAFTKPTLIFEDNTTNVNNNTNSNPQTHIIQSVTNKYVNNFGAGNSNLDAAHPSDQNKDAFQYSASATPDNAQQYVHNTASDNTQQYIHNTASDNTQYIYKDVLVNTHQYIHNAAPNNTHQYTHNAASDNIQQNTHYSESQVNVIIHNEPIHGIKTNNQKTIDGPTNVNETQDVEMNVVSQNSQNIYKQAFSQCVGDSGDIFSQDALNIDVTDRKQENANANESESLLDNVFSQDTQTMSYNSYNLINYLSCYHDNETDNTIITNENNVFNDTPKVINKIAAINGDATVINENNETGSNNQNGGDNVFDDKEMEGELSDEQSEGIPFKVIEDMNKVKMYLSKRSVEYSHETGFRSGSQPKCSYGVSQSSTQVLNRAATSLCEYITNCDLNIASHDITTRISDVLGQLIDRLHDEENYPSFIEELLETVKNLVTLIYVGKAYDEEVALIKDDQIQRLLLLTKSPHLQEYTIKKINESLEKLLEEFTDDATWDIKNISKMENLCYTFHVLQIFLEKYVQNSNSQQSESSQEKALRKRDITDLWRKKWMTNFKEEKEVEIAGSPQNKCVLKECSAILNRIIVTFMDGYSLIAYFALKCFNIMQN